MTWIPRGGPDTAPHPLALSAEEVQPFEAMTGLLGAMIVADAFELPKPTFEVGLMRVWYDGEPRAAIIVSQPDPDVEGSWLLTPVALMLRAEDQDRMSDEPPGE